MSPNEWFNHYVLYGNCKDKYCINIHKLNCTDQDH